ncbi:167aa long hypothetical protein [Pyrococcus horikoshii OT3]|uniref:Uncharacterized protein n=1 Tax=Pyrococcus horikoshii (strain ATCC 700860 / DSM 12428 / JCM 9974 / NBRC 100139 / OT-3) TaxID=70601 RepID=O57850_PYRHO|nr:167aa long hypothetical protein [Pyrococcus horikoshii OT3]
MYFLLTLPFLSSLTAWAILTSLGTFRLVLLVISTKASWSFTWGLSKLMGLSVGNVIRFARSSIVLIPIFSNTLISPGGIPRIPRLLFSRASERHKGSNWHVVHLAVIQASLHLISSLSFSSIVVTNSKTSFGKSKNSRGQGKLSLVTMASFILPLTILSSSIPYITA